MLRIFWPLATLVVFAVTAVAQPDPAADRELLRSMTAVPAPAETVPGELSRFQVDLNATPVRSGVVRQGDRVRIAVPAGEQTFAVTRVESFVEGTMSVAGIAADGSDDVVTLTFADEGAAGVLTVDGVLYHVVWVDGQAVLLEMDPHGVDALECAITDAEMPHGMLDLSAEAMAEATAPFHMMTLGDYGHDLITIDIILAYTERARLWSNANYGSIEAVIGQMMNLSQLALDNSEAYVHLRIVHAYETVYDETIPNMPGVSTSSSHLRRFTAGPHYNPWGSNAAGYMEEVHELRDEYGADLASLLAEVSGFGGVAWLLGNISGSPLGGFSVNRVQQMASGYTFVHEIGHNMGNHHSRNQSSAAAPARGGIFPYSTGWRFDAPNNPGANSYATVMTYQQSGSPRVPYFSNPDISFEGVPTGSYTGGGAPADNARSMRETKRIIAAYRPTRHEPPVAGVSPSAIEVAANGGMATATVEIANTGESDLMWEVDLRPSSAQRPAGAPAAMVAYGDETHTGLWFTADGNHISPTDAMRADGTIYQTDFSSSDGFGIGTHHHESGWVSRVSSTPFWILGSNASTGSQHMRIGVTSSGNSATVHSPFFGAWPTGAYEVSLDLFVSDTGPLHVVEFRDGRTGEPTAGVALQSTGQLLVMSGVSATGSPTYALSGHTWSTGTYQTYTFRVRPEEAEVDYLRDGTLVATQPFVAGTTFGQLQIGRSSGFTSIYMDVDNLLVQQLYPGFDWMEIDTWSGVTSPGQTSEIQLTFDGTPNDTGLNEAVLVLRTNLEDPDQIEVPIQVTVPVGTEGGAGEFADRLLGNHPNPARNTTAITYELGQPGPVTIELFSVTGQRVRVLVDEYRGTGTHEATLDVAGLASGVYLYRLTTDHAVDSGRLVVVR